MPPASAFSRLAFSWLWPVLGRARSPAPFLLFAVGFEGGKITAAVRWMSSRLSASSAALPWYR